MSKVLRRPLFRGGPVDPRGTGITSGLDDGRVRKQTGGGFTYYDTLGINKPYLVSQRPYLVPNMFGGKGYQVSRGPIYEGPSSMADMSLSELIQSQLAEKGDVFYRPESEIENLSVGAPELTDDELYNYRLKQQKVKKTQDEIEDRYDKNSREARDNNLYASRNDTATDATYPNDIYDIEGVADEGKALGPVNTGGLNTFENLGIMGKEYAKVRANNEKVYDKIKARQEAREKAREKARARTNETEISKDDIEAIFAEPLKKARRGDIADVLGGAAEGFLTGGLREGLVGATRAARAPGRTEQIENAIASLKAQSKLLEGKEERAFENEIKKLEKIKELGLGKTGQETDLSKKLDVIKNPEKYPPDVVNAIRQQFNLTSLPQLMQEAKEKMRPVSYSDFLDFVQITEPEFDTNNIIPADKVDSLISKLDDGVYVVQGQKRLIKIKDRKISDRNWND